MALSEVEGAVRDGVLIDGKSLAVVYQARVRGIL
jgi:hypothetical protein